MRAALLCLCLVVVAGCKVKNPNYCEDTDDHLCMQPDAKPETCSATDPCDTGVCKEPPGECVQCLTNAECTTAAAPVCNTMTNVCGKCTEHTQCPSGVCRLDDGQCEAESAVAYVDGATGNDTGSCAKSAPCDTITYAQGRDKAIIKVDGDIVDTVVIDGPSLSIYGGAGATLSRNGGTILEVKGTSDVKIYGLTITGMGTATTGVIMPSGSPKLRLDRVRLESNNTRGINMSSGTLELVRSNVINNANGGIVITGGVFAIVGNMFTNNGDDTSGVGAMNILTGMSSMHRLEFNSFTRNESVAGQAPAIHCVVTGFTARNNILYLNPPAGGVPQVNAGGCAHSYSLVEPMTPSGTMNIGGDPMFVNTTTGDLHIKAGSPVLGKADPATQLGAFTNDLDGNVRANPADMGADEIP